MILVGRGYPLEALAKFAWPKLNRFTALAEDQNAQDALLLAVAVWDGKQVLRRSKALRLELLGDRGAARNGDDVKMEIPTSQEEFERMLSA